MLLSKMYSTLLKYGFQMFLFPAEEKMTEKQADRKTVCLMGSMNLREDIDYPTDADLLILPYNGWEDNFPPAVWVIERLQPKRILLDHYDDSFPPITMLLSLILEKYKGTVSAIELGKTEEV